MDSNTNAITPNPNPATSAPPPLQPSLPPLIPTTGAPPPLPGARRRDSSPLRKVISFLLSLCLVLFIAHGFVSLLDDCLILFLHAHVLGGLRGIAFLFAIVAGIGIYALMGLTPMIPKRLFLPVSLFNPLAGLAIIPFLIYFYNQAQWISWIVSLVQVVVGLAILFWLRANALQRTHSPARAAERQPSDSLSPGAADQVSVEKKSDPGRGEGGLSSKSIFPAQENKTADLPLFPLVQEQQLNPRAFSWLNLSAFVVINFFILFPAALIYLFFCASLAVNHLSQGFLSLQPQGFTVQVRKYVRKDGKMIQLVPMAH